jgi:hypothetical protein
VAQCCKCRFDLRLAPPHSREQAAVIADHIVTVRVGVTRIALEPEEDRQCAAHQRLRLVEPVGGLQQPGEVVEVARDVRVVDAEACLVNGERAAIQRLRLAEPVGVVQQLSEIVEGSPDVRMAAPRLVSRMASARRINGSASSIAWCVAATRRGC